MVDVVPGNDVMHARCHGGTNGEDKALFEGPPQQAQDAVPLGAVWEISHAVRSRVPHPWVRMLRLPGRMTAELPFIRLERHERSLEVENTNQHRAS